MRYLKTLPRRLTALGLAFTLTFSTAWATAGEEKLQTSVQMVDGLTYRNTITENSGSRIESFAFELSPDSPVKAILLQGDETIYGGGSITQVVATAQAQGYHVLGAVNTDFFSITTGIPMGIVIEDGVYKSSNYLENAMVIGPEGISLVELPEVALSLYNHTNDTTVIPDHFNKLRNSGGGIYLLNSDFSTVSTRSDGAGWYVRLKLTDGEPPAETVPPEPETTEPTDSTEEGPVVPTGMPLPAIEPTASPEESPVSSPLPTDEGGEAEREVTSTPEASTEEEPTEDESQESPEPAAEPEPVPTAADDVVPEETDAPEETDSPEESEDAPERKLRVNGTLNFVVVEVTRSEKSLPMAQDEYILTAVDQYRGDIFESFQVGDWITLTASCDDPALSSAQWACGVGDIMVREGEYTDASSWIYRNDGRQPRTAMGLKPDGTLVLYAVDGRSSGYSSGLTQMDLAEELWRQGCTWVANLDGGGSTALAAWLPGQETVYVQNRPSDGSPRRCATYLLLVTEAGDGTPERLALIQEGQTVLTGTSLVLPQAVAIDSGLALAEADFSELTVASGGLGAVSEGVYTAGTAAGTDTLFLQAGKLTGSTQLHVVDSLTQMQVGRAGADGVLSSLRVFTGARVDLTLGGSYWGREALRGFGGETWSVQGDVGTVDLNGRFVAASRPAEGSITCTVGGLSQTIAVTVVDRHEDVQPGHWAYDSVEYCYEAGIVSGVSLTQFGRDNPIRRGDFIQMLYNAMGRPESEWVCTFLDVDPSAYYYRAITWAQELELATGVGEGNFAPGDSLTREQAFTLLYRFMTSQGVTLAEGDSAILEQFPDGEQVSEYAQIPTAALVELGLVGGKNNGLAPRDTLTRAEMAALMCRIMEFEPDLAVNLDREPGIPGVVDAPEPPPPPEEPEEPEEPGEPEITVRIGWVTGISSRLRVRSGPGADFEVLGQLHEGDMVEIMEELEGWYVIRYPAESETFGYVSAEYITLEDSPEAEAEIE